MSVHSVDKHHYVRGHPVQGTNLELRVHVPCKGAYRVAACLHGENGKWHSTNASQLSSPERLNSCTALLPVQGLCSCGFGGTGAGKTDMDWSHLGDESVGHTSQLSPGQTWHDAIENDRAILGNDCTIGHR